VDARCHLCSRDELAPGKSWLFSLPREYLTEGRSMRVSFFYEWEEDEDLSNFGEPQHFVYFYSSRLPKDLPEARRSQ
jgi:hypothetical protein